MWQECEPDEKIDVAVDGYRVAAYSYGASEETVLC
jgi:proline iminopeptidase